MIEINGTIYEFKIVDTTDVLACDQCDAQLDCSMDHAKCLCESHMDIPCIVPCDEPIRACVMGYKDWVLKRRNKR